MSVRITNVSDPLPLPWALLPGSILHSGCAIEIHEDLFDKHKQIFDEWEAAGQVEVKHVKPAPPLTVDDAVDAVACNIAREVDAQFVASIEAQLALLPCPFCGTSFPRLLPQPGGFSIDCRECGARVRETTQFEEQVVAKWNRRA